MPYMIVVHCLDHCTKGHHHRDHYVCFKIKSERFVIFIQKPFKPYWKETCHKQLSEWFNYGFWKNYLIIFFIKVVLLAYDFYIYSCVTQSYSFFHHPPFDTNHRETLSIFDFIKIQFQFRVTTKKKNRKECWKIWNS